MNYKPLKIDNLISKLPIIQGGMGVGISLSSLAGNVAKLGGIGVISAAHPGYNEPDFNKNPINANIKALKNEIQKAKHISNNGIIGVNLMVAMKNYDKYVQATIDGGADLIISGAGLPLDLPKYTANSNIKIIPIVSSRKAAKIILRYWDKHYNTTADAIIYEGHNAGGHLGFKKDDLLALNLNDDDNIKDILKEIPTYENKFNKEIPLIAAGGIFTGEDVKHYLDLGANGVQVATRFVTTYECDAHINFKNAYLNANEKDIKITISPVGMPARAINNNFLKTVTGEDRHISKCFNCLSHCNPKSTPYCITSALISAVKGDMENGLVFCGSNAYKLNKLQSVEEVLTELISNIN